MAKVSPLKVKTMQFGLKVVDLVRLLREGKAESSICNQLLRSGTAIGAMVCEAEFAQSRADFINKLYIALKEANETNYWLNILFGSNNLRPGEHQDAISLLDEVIRMLVSSLKTAKKSGIK